ncbi:MAG TPA: RHS repeat-associated core domain-containing protein [Anaerolineales bacterium]|nr:RHS repeat-associated core domain-containing protein [Anaerolineales bacterium]
MSAYDEAYNARWYDPVLGRFAQADTISFVEALPNPTDAKVFDRYAYVYNNPVRYNDPSGHCIGAGGKVKAVKGGWIRLAGQPISGRDTKHKFSFCPYPQNLHHS